MIFTANYASPLGGILLAADELGLTGLWFTGAKYFGAGLPASAVERRTLPFWQRPGAGWKATSPGSALQLCRRSTRAVRRSAARYGTFC